ncbi:hypothetical protein C8R48DRAFT_769661 [Suillus tomentosus]|nr:hypothetical protein C8R48DRAFT_769661 [Suillus tomentosus]
MSAINTSRIYIQRDTPGNAHICVMVINPTTTPLDASKYHSFLIRACAQLIADPYGLDQSNADSWNLSHSCVCAPLQMQQTRGDKFSMGASPGAVYATPQKSKDVDDKYSCVRLICQERNCPIAHRQVSHRSWEDRSTGY